MDKLLTTMVDKFLKDHPLEEVHYVLSSKDNFYRNHEYQYLLLPEEQMAPLAIGAEVTFTAILKRKPTEEKTTFFVEPLGPTKVYINGELAYAGNLKKPTNHPRHAHKFSFATPLRENKLQVVCQKSASGVGAIFGTGSAKGDPFFVWQPEEAEVEGWQLARKGTPTPREVTNTNFLAALLRQLEQWAIATAQVEVATAGTFQVVGLPAGTVFMVTTPEINGEETQMTRYVDPQTISLKEGTQRIFILTNQEDALQDFGLFTSAGKKMAFTSTFGLKTTTWSYLGPLSYEEGCHFTGDLQQIINSESWQARQPGYYLRPYLTSSVFGRWTYPVGVTLKGLIDYGLTTQNTSVLAYVEAHLQCCTSFFTRVAWDKQKFGAPLMNFCLNMMDSLDDCGSMAYTLLYFQRQLQKTLPGAPAVITACATYILKEQRRLPDDCLYRKNNNNGVWEETVWADDLYMSIPFLSEYYRLTGDGRILHRILREFQVFAKKLALPESSLYAHVYDVTLQKNTGVVWGRGCGWFLLALAIALENTTETVITAELQQFFATLAPAFVKELGPDNFWHQVLTDANSYPETSCTMIALYACGKSQLAQWTPQLLNRLQLEKIATAVLPQVIDPAGNLTGVCRGSGYSFDPQYYKERLLPRTNDLHGIGITLSAYCQLTHLTKE